MSESERTRHALVQPFSLGTPISGSPAPPARVSLSCRLCVQSIRACSWLHPFKEVHLRWAFCPVRREPDPMAGGRGQPRECATHVLLPEDELSCRGCRARDRWASLSTSRRTEGSAAVAPGLSRSCATRHVHARQSSKPTAGARSGRDARVAAQIGGAGWVKPCSAR